MTGSDTRVRDIPAVLLTAGRLVARHWPALLALAFLGTGLRAGVLWLAVIVSDQSSFAAQLILVLAPLGYLLPIIAMLYLCRGSLPNVSALDAMPGPEATTEKRERRLVDVSVSMLVPFLAVYVSYGLLDEDRQRFINEAAFAEFNQFNLARPPDYDFAGRVGIYAPLTVLAIVLVAWVLRFALGRIEQASRFLALAFVGALVEVYWTSQVARRLTGIQTSAVDWVEQRRVATDVVGWYDDSVGRLGWLANPIDTVTTWLFAVIGSVDAVIVVPVAWLTVGAVVLGHKLSPPPAREPHPRWQRVPPVVRTASSSLLADLRERWSAFWGGLRLLGAAGFAPMLAFGLVFLLAIRLPVLVSQLVRLVTGPVDTITWLAFSPMERSLGMAVSMALTAPLLAAAMDWLVAPKLAEQTRDRGQQVPEPTAP
ncbi:MAG: hypothetical protein ABWX73_14930 [Marmoricola sp.]